MFIIAGLGNPGKQYENTRHNVGFMAIDKLAERNGINVNRIKHKAIMGDGFINGKKAALIKPQTFMNLSGESVKEVMNFYKADIADLIVIFDDINLDVGATRIREKGSAGGHNGMKNIISLLNSQDFKRVRIGIGAKPQGWDLVDYVLGRFQPNELDLIKSAVEKSAEAIEIMLAEGAQAAMNKAHTKSAGGALK